MIVDDFQKEVRMRLNELTGIERPFFSSVERHSGIGARVRAFGVNTSRLGIASAFSSDDEVAGGGTLVPTHGIVKIDDINARERQKREIIHRLIEALELGNKEVRYRAATLLSQIGPQARNAVPALIRTLSDNEPLVIQQSAIALGEIGPEASNAVPALVEALKNGNEFVRTAATGALGKIGRFDETVIIALTEAKKDWCASVRRNAEIALRKFLP